MCRNLRKKKELGRTNEIIILFEKYKIMKSKLIENGRSKNDIIKLQFKYFLNVI